MIRFDDVSFAYDDEAPVVLDRVDLTVPEGDLALVIGPTGSGKSTLLGAIPGLVPRFSGGVLAGTVTVDGVATSTAAPATWPRSSATFPNGWTTASSPTWSKTSWHGRWSSSAWPPT